MARRSFVMTYERKGKLPNNFGEHSFSATNISISKFIDICMALSITAMLHLSILLIIFTLMISTKKGPTFNWFLRLRAWSNWMLLMYLQRKNCLIWSSYNMNVNNKRYTLHYEHMSLWKRYAAIKRWSKTHAYNGYIKWQCRWIESDFKAELNLVFVVSLLRALV